MAAPQQTPSSRKQNAIPTNMILYKGYFCV
jgi:hypothetical protein